MHGHLKFKFHFRVAFREVHWGSSLILNITSCWNVMAEISNKN